MFILKVFFLLRTLKKLGVLAHRQSTAKLTRAINQLGNKLTDLTKSQLGPLEGKKK